MTMNNNQKSLVAAFWISLIKKYGNEEQTKIYLEKILPGNLYYFTKDGRLLSTDVSNLTADVIQAVFKNDYDTNDMLKIHKAIEDYTDHGETKRMDNPDSGPND